MQYRGDQRVAHSVESQRPTGQAASPSRMVPTGRCRLELDELEQALQVYKLDFDQAFTLLANHLPRLHQDIEKLVSLFDALTGRGSEESLIVELQASLQLTDELGQLVSMVLLRDGALRDSARTLAQDAGAMLKSLESVNRLASKMRMFALNGTVAAAQSGADGMAFAVLTQELVELTSETASTVKAVAATSQEVGLQVDEVLTYSETAHQRHEQMFAAARGAIEETASAVRRLVSDAYATLQTAAAETRSLQDPIRRIMVSIQQQDILRQSIEHVQAAVKEASFQLEAMGEGPLSDTPEAQEEWRQRVAFVVQASELGAKLIGDVEGKLDALHQEIDIQFEQLKKTASSLSQFQTRLEPGTGLRQELIRPLEQIEAALKTFQSSLEVLERHARLSETLAHFSGKLPGEIDEFHAIKRHLDIVNVMMRIEVARTEALANAVALAEDIQGLCAGFMAFLKEMRMSIGGLGRRVASFHGVVRSERMERQRRLEAFKGRFGGSSGRMERAIESFVAGLTQVVEVGKTVEKETAVFQRELGKTTSRQADSPRLQQQCEGISSKVRALSLRYGIQVESIAVSTQMAALINRFTTLSHKAIASEMTGLEIERGDDCGELTLF